MSLLSMLTSNPQQALSLLSVLSQNPVQGVSIVANALSGLGVLDPNIARTVASFAAGHAGERGMTFAALLRSPAVSDFLAKELNLPPIPPGHEGGIDLQSRVLANIPGSFTALSTISSTALIGEAEIDEVARAVEVIGIVDADTVRRFVQLMAQRGADLNRTLFELVNSRDLLRLFPGEQQADEGATIQCPFCDELNYFEATPFDEIIECGHCHESIFLGS